MAFKTINVHIERGEGEASSMAIPAGFPAPPGAAPAVQPDASNAAMSAPAISPVAPMPPVQVQQVQPQAVQPQVQAPQVQAPQLFTPAQAEFYASLPQVQPVQAQVQAPQMPIANVTIGTVAAPATPHSVSPTPGTVHAPVVMQPVVMQPVVMQPVPVVTQPISHVVNTGVQPTTAAPNAPPAVGVTLPSIGADEEETGYTVGIYGPPGSGKTMSLRNLARGVSKVVANSPKRVLYLDLKGNPSAIKGFINPEHWLIKRPITFMGMLKNIVENSGPNAKWPYDILVIDQIYQMQEMFISHFKGRDMSDPNMLMSMFSADSWKTDGKKTGPDIAQNEWAVISAAMKQAVDKILTFANKSLGGKDVIMVFQDGRSDVTGQRCPQIVGKLRELIAASFQAFFLITKNADNQHVMQTFHDGLVIAKHTFNKCGPNGEVFSLLAGWEPADLGAIFDKIEQG